MGTIQEGGWGLLVAGSIHRGGGGIEYYRLGARGLVVDGSGGGGFRGGRGNCGDHVVGESVGGGGVVVGVGVGVVVGSAGGVVIVV